MTEKRIKKWANLLVNHSIVGQFKEKFGDASIRGKIIIVEGEVCTEPLMRAIEAEIVKANGFPVLIPFFSNRNRRNPFSSLATVKYGNETQINFIPDSFINLAMQADAFITILGSEDPFVFKNHLEGLKKLKLAGSKYDKNRFNKIWTLTLYPTKAEATLENMQYKEYSDFVINSVLSDYNKMEKDYKHIVDEITNAKIITLKTYHPKEKRLLTLEMNKENNRGWGLYGHINVPDGEILTSPKANSVEGEIYLDIPVLYGKMIEGVYLKFKKGKIIKYTAEKGHDALKGIIESDEGSKKIGEFAIGINTKINKILSHVLFSEKIGGTIHIAIGKSYDEPFRELDGLTGLEKDMIRNQLIEEGIYSTSAQHADIPKDLRKPKKGEGVFLDNKELYWDKKMWKIR